MGTSELIGKRKEKQLNALGYLEANDGLTYVELKEELNLDEEEMQEVMRGINYNGLAKRSVDDSGERVLLPDW